MFDSFSVNSVVIIITCIFILTMPCSYGSNDDNAQGFYNLCHSLLYSCGPLKNLGYPFWGDDRPEFCGGKPEFKLSCWKDGSLPHINRNLRVLSITQSSSTVLVSLGDELTCWDIHRSSSLNLTSLFKLGPKSVVNLTLLPDNCFRPFNDNRCKNISCPSLDHNEYPVFWYCNPDNREAEMVNFSKSCKGRVEVPVLKTSLYQLNHGKITLENVFEKGFELEYTVPNLSDCKACQNAGGTCGSSGNPSWEFKCYYPERKKIPQLLIVGLGTTGGIIIILTLAYRWYCKRYKSRSVSMNGSFEHMTSNLEEGRMYFHVPLFSYRELEEATNKFDASKELGSGGFGRVYYGRVRDGREVAVKRLYENSCRRVNQFMNEVKILTSLRHQHLVSLYGCTPINNKELFLVYEYVPNGTVADHLFGNKSKYGILLWNIRMKIAIETAIALSYLHSSDIIHRDVKTNNILLDNNFGVKVADFGLSRLFPNDVTHVSTAPQGTPGYVDPEYHQCYQLTKKSDVYSFGVVLIELLSSLPAVDTNRVRHEINLSSYAIDRIKRCAFDELVDPELGFGRDPYIRKTTTLVAELAFRCLQHNKDFRPTMNEVLAELKRIESARYDSPETKLTPLHVEDDGARLLDTRQKHPSLQHSELYTWHSTSTKLRTSEQDLKFLTSCQTF